MTTVPLLDLRRQYLALEGELSEAMEAVAASGRYILGPNLIKLEEELADYCDCRNAIGVANGTDALHLALRAARIGPGDEVITTSFTFIATSEAIGMVGARPIFVDIQPATFNLDPTRLEAAITPRTKAIIPVHLFGQPCDMTPILDVARRHGLRVIEDCAQAIGARYDGRPVGSMGDLGCFSFFPSKNLGCFGDGGMVLTNNDSLAERVDMLRRHGGRKKYLHEELGLNSRLDELQAAILRVKLPHLDAWNAARRAIARRYNEALAGLDWVVTPREIDGVEAVYHQYTIRAQRRDTLKEKLAAAGVQSAIYYPVPLHLQRVHTDLGLEKGSLPETERAASEVLSLPIFPELEDKQIEKVARAFLTEERGM